MYYSQVRDEKDALLYLTDCLLATVSDMAGKKSKGVYEYKRHIAIAQDAVDMIKKFGANVKVDSRLYKVLCTDSQKVEEWVKRYSIDTNTGLFKEKIG